jgi:hypothetical protein
MPIFKIEPVSIVTVGSLQATITGIQPGLTDNFVGTILSKKNGVIDVAWDTLGRCRNQDSETCNLDSSSDEFRDLVSAARIFNG